MSTLIPDQGLALYTDGSSHMVDRSGGWAWKALDAYGASVHMSGWSHDATNNLMELYAPTHGLNQLYEWYGPCEVLVRSDSQYVVFGITDRTRKRNKNIEFWDALDLAVDQHSYVVFEHVRGHQRDGDPHNAFVDKEAGKARKRGLAERKP